MKTLKEEVKEIVENHSDGYDNKEQGFISDLRQGGCVSGLVGELISYNQTMAFYEKHKEAINELLEESREGLTLEEIFGDNWDTEDRLILDMTNQNLLAWFAFEETAFEMYPED